MNQNSARRLEPSLRNPLALRCRSTSRNRTVAEDFQVCRLKTKVHRVVTEVAELRNDVVIRLSRSLLAAHQTVSRLDPSCPHIGFYTRECVAKTRLLSGSACHHDQIARSALRCQNCTRGCPINHAVGKTVGNAFVSRCFAVTGWSAVRSKEVCEIRNSWTEVGTPRAVTVSRRPGKGWLANLLLAPLTATTILAIASTAVTRTTPTTRRSGDSASHRRVASSMWSCRTRKGCSSRRSSLGTTVIW